MSSLTNLNGASFIGWCFCVPLNEGDPAPCWGKTHVNHLIKKLTGRRFKCLLSEEAAKAFLLEFMPPTHSDSITPQRGRSDICCICEMQSERGPWLHRPHCRLGYWLLNIIFDISGAPAFRMATKSLSI